MAELLGVETAAVTKSGRQSCSTDPGSSVPSGRPRFRRASDKWHTLTLAPDYTTVIGGGQTSIGTSTRLVEARSTPARQERVARVNGG